MRTSQRHGQEMGVTGIFISLREIVKGRHKLAHQWTGLDHGMSRLGFKTPS